jgi:hypothetical protein
MESLKRHDLIGCCGISCGLCPRYQSKAKSRCLGCGPDGHCSYCSIFRCCVIKRNYQTCADCTEFPCNKFEKWFDGDSFVTHRKCFPNINKIKEIGIDAFLKEQQERKELLELMLEKYNTGRSASLFCLASALLSIKSLNEALEQIDDIRTDKPQAFTRLIQELAERENVSLKLRK